MSLISERLRKARNRKGYKQTDVQARTGINNKTLSGYENGVSEPDLNTLRILSELYEVTIDWLTGKTSLDDVERAITEKPIDEILEEYREVLTYDGKKISDADIKMILNLLKYKNERGL